MEILVNARLSLPSLTQNEVALSFGPVLYDHIVENINIFTGKLDKTLSAVFWCPRSLLCPTVFTLRLSWYFPDQSRTFKRPTTKTTGQKFYNRTVKHLRSWKHNQQVGAEAYVTYITFVSLCKLCIEHLIMSQLIYFQHGFFLQKKCYLAFPSTLCDQIIHKYSLNVVRR